MSLIQYTVEIESSYRKVWEVLKDKVENPEKYMEGIEEIRFLEKNPRRVVREMVSDITLKEIIDIDEEYLQLTYTLMDHPLLEGSILNQIHDISGEKVKLTFSLVWKERQQMAGALSRQYFYDILKKSADLVKDLVERKEVA